MPARIFALVSLLTCAGFTAAPTTNPTTAPAIAPTTAPAIAPATAPASVAAMSPTTAPASIACAVPASSAAPPTAAPANAPAATAPPATAPAGKLAAKFPTPAELYEKIKKHAEERSKLLKVAYFDLSEPITEKPSEFSLFGGERGVPLRNLLDRLRKAQRDTDVQAVLITIGTEASLNLAQAGELRDQLSELRRADKKVFVYADSFDTVGYTIASGATDICLLPGGEIMIPGIGLETMFYKGTMDKLGVQADYIQIGEYKGAEEPYTRTGPSEELRGELTKLTEAMYDQIVDGISMGRNVSRESVKRLIDDTMLGAEAARDRGFVDHVTDVDGIRELIKDEIGGDIDLVANYGAPKREEIDLSNPFLLLASLTKKPEPSHKPQVAVIYAEGTIVDGEGEAGLFGGGGVGSDALRRHFRIAMKDDNVKAVVLRIDSPGGSALASEVMWQAARRLAAKKPLIVSIGSMAASGGYYLASSGEYIFSDPSGIVGSIGVVGGKFVTKDLYDKLGLATENFSKGRNAGLFSSNQPWSDRQRRMVRTWMQQTYDQFTQRVMTTRAGKIGDIDQVARGRIFLARQAKELGMVDELGGTQAAIAYAAKRAGLDAGAYDVRTLPAPRTLADLFAGGGGESDEIDSRLPFAARAMNVPLLKITIGPDSILGALSPNIRREIGQQVQMLQLLQQRPVVLMSPFVVNVK